MFRREIISHLLVSLVYFSLLLVLRWRWDFSLIWLILGALAGTFLLDLDYFFFRYVHQEKVNFAGLRGEISERQPGLIFHTATFQIILLVVTFYVLTSSESNFGAGLVLAMNLHLLKDELWDYWQKGEETLAKWLLWQIKDSFLQQHLKFYLIVISILFAGLSFLLIL